VLVEVVGVVLVETKTTQIMLVERTAIVVVGVADVVEEGGVGAKAVLLERQLQDRVRSRRQHP
jgi:hypothetical protein